MMHRLRCIFETAVPLISLIVRIIYSFFSPFLVRQIFLPTPL